MAKKKAKKKKKAGKGRKYKRGDLGRAIYAYFDNVGVEDADYEQCLKIAKGVLPTTKFDKSHFSWYKNHYENMKG